ncbi:STAS domain-containing protein [Nonomuraea sp. NPDC050556]|uniref:STAS domain-containing protein n=1 Tax=Nonomuraea sp. NPDC050556 TaxID=3364369 RepID=UPI0037A7930B
METLRVKLRPGDGHCVVALSGEIDIGNLREVRWHLLSALEAGSSRVLVDVSELRFIDSNGLAVLVDVLERARSRGGELALLSPDERFRRTLAWAELSGTFPILESHPHDQ